MGPRPRALLQGRQIHLHLFILVLIPVLAPIRH